MRLRTGYSFRAAAGSIGECIERIKEVGWPVAPITDRASTFGWVKWEKAAKEAGLRPVFGVELAVAEHPLEKNSPADHWVFLAVDDLEPINRLVELATEQFYRQPRLSYAQALGASGVIKVVGHRSRLDLIRHASDVFYGLSPASSKGHVKRAVEAGLPIVATSDNFFPREDDLAFYEVLCGRGASTQTYDQFIQDDERWLASTARSGLSEEERREALALRDELWGRCKAELKAAELVHPPRPAPLREMCEQGAAELGVDLSDPVYKARLDRELELIEAKQFEDYFYLVADICQRARKKMAVGPARGSSCGSLVCYLLRITTVDPIPHGLIFERFIDLNRSDLPDIDIDFSDQSRYQVFEDMEEVYGSDRVARLGTVAMFKARSSLQEAGAALSIPKWRTDAVAEALVERSSADSRATDTLEDTLTGTEPGRKVLDEWPEIMIAARMEGHPRHYSQHAAGVVVASEPVLKYVAIDHRTGATMCDKDDAEGRLGLLKIDALGLTQLSVFEDCLKAVGMTMEELQRVPTDDQKAFDILNRKEFSGIFQWNGRALQSLTSQIHVDRFDDIVAISALARPGPLATGGSGQWVKGRRGEADGQKALHPMLEQLTEDTFGVIVYQEQVMRVVREMGGMSWEETSSIRKAMSKRLGNEFFESFKKKFVAGAGENGVDAETATKIWDQINTFGSWAFNKSHAVAYGYISYWCCWLKAHFPFEFAAATLNHETEVERQIIMLRELRDEGYDYVPVDPAVSEDKWTAFVGSDGQKKLLGPLQNINGIGPVAVGQILKARRDNRSVSAGLQKKLNNPETKIDSLTPVSDAIQRIMPDPRDRSIFSTPTPLGELEGAAGPYEAMVFCTPIYINPRDENEEMNIRKRGYKIEDGLTDFLQLRIMDDTGVIMAKVNRYNYKAIGKQIEEKGRPGKTLWAFKGKVFTLGDPSEGFVILSIEQARYIGDMDE